jgi:hypothetical protein
VLLSQQVFEPLLLLVLLETGDFCIDLVIIKALVEALGSEVRSGANRGGGVAGMPGAGKGWGAWERLAG